MPLRGENVGTAYVRILADGTGLAKSIEDELQDTDDVFDEGGRRNARVYDEALQKQLIKDRPKNQKEVNKAFTADTRRIRQLTEEMSTTYFKNLERNILRQNTGKLGEKVVAQFRKGFVEGGGYKQFGKDLEGLFDKLPGYVKKANAEVLREEQALAREIAAQEKRIDRDRRAAFAERDRLFNESTRNIVAGLNRISRGETEFGVSLTRSMRGVRNEARGLLDELNRNPTLGGQGREDLIRQLRQVNREASIGTPRLDRYNRGILRLSDITGRAFGRGSRNNFLNFVGSFARGIVSLLSLIPKFISAALQFGQTMKFVFDETLRDTGSASRAAMAVIISAIETGGASLAALAAGFVVLAAILPVVVALISLTGGVLVALAATLSGALIAGLIGLAGLILPIAAGLAVLVAGIVSMDDASKRMLKQSIQPLVKEFKTLGAAAREGLLTNIKPTIGFLTTAFRGLKPLVKEIGVALSDVGLSFAKSLNSDGFKNFRDAMEKFLPNAIRQLGEIFKNTLGGLGGFFVAAIPFVDRFLASLESITQKFSDFTNSAEGQAKLQTFFASVEQSAAAVKDLLGSIGGLIKTVFFSASDSGDDIITGLADKIREFTDYLNENPDTVKNFFGDVTDFAESVGRAIEEVAKFVDYLDSPGNRQAVIGLFKAVQIYVKIAGDNVKGLVKIFGDVFGSLTETLGKFLQTVAGAIEPLSNVPGFGWVKGVSADLRAAGIEVEFLGKGLDKLGEPRTFSITDNGTIATNQTGIAALLASMINVSNTPVGITDNASPVLRDITLAAQSLDTLTPTIVAGANGEPARLEFNNLFGLADDYSNTNPSTTADANQKPAKKVFDSLAKIMRDYEKSNPTTDIDAKDKASEVAEGVFDAFPPDVWTTTFNGRRGNIGGIIGGIFRSIQNALGGSSAAGSIFDETGQMHQVRKMAAGGFANFQQMYRGNLIGEAGREAIVPLDRPLGQVDPSVRALAAIAQGKYDQAGTTSTGVNASGWVINTPSADPVAVAYEVLGQLALQSNGGG